MPRVGAASIDKVTMRATASGREKSDVQSFIGRAWFPMDARRVSVLKTVVSLLVEVLKVHFTICTNPAEIVGG